MERSGNLRHRELGILEVHRRRTGDDAQIVDVGETSDERLGQAVGEVFLGWIARQVFQRQHRQRTDFGSGRAACVAPGHHVGGSQQAENSHRTQNDPATRPRRLPCFVVTFRLHWRLYRTLLLLLFLLQTQSAALHPGIELGTERVDRAHPVMLVAMNGHPLALLPALDRGYVAA